MNNYRIINPYRYCHVAASLTNYCEEILVIFAGMMTAEKWRILSVPLMEE